MPKATDTLEILDIIDRRMIIGAVCRLFQELHFVGQTQGLVS